MQCHENGVSLTLPLFDSLKKEAERSGPFSHISNPPPQRTRGRAADVGVTVFPARKILPIVRNAHLPPLVLPRVQKAEDRGVPCAGKPVFGHSRSDRRFSNKGPERSASFSRLEKG